MTNAFFPNHSSVFSRGHENIESVSPSATGALFLTILVPFPWLCFFDFIFGVARQTSRTSHHRDFQVPHIHRRRQSSLLVPQNRHSKCVRAFAGSDRGRGNLDTKPLAVGEGSGTGSRSSKLFKHFGFVSVARCLQTRSKTCMLSLWFTPRRSLWREWKGSIPFFLVSLSEPLRERVDDTKHSRTHFEEFHIRTSTQLTV